jgi:hypothetical protein
VTIKIFRKKCTVLQNKEKKCNRTKKSKKIFLMQNKFSFIPHYGKNFQFYEIFRLKGQNKGHGLKKVIIDTLCPVFRGAQFT